MRNCTSSIRAILHSRTPALLSQSGCVNFSVKAPCPVVLLRLEPMEGVIMSVSGNITVVAVHGAWADGSCWKNVILGLEREGLGVIAAPIPLTSLGDDIAALMRAIARTDGPLILTG